MKDLTSESTRSGREDGVRKSRDVTTQRTRTWKRRILLSAISLGIAMLVRRLRGRRRDRTPTTGDTGVEAGRTSGDSGGRSTTRRLAMMAVSAAVAAAIRRRRNRTSTRKP